MTRRPHLVAPDLSGVLVTESSARSGPRIRARVAQREAVLIVIPTYNEASSIEGVLHGLLSDLPADVDARFVVADGGSTDATRAIVEQVAASHPAVTLLHNPGRLQSSGVNLATRVFGRQADVLIRCDAHAAYPPHFCRRLLETMVRTGADAVVVPMDSEGATPLQRAVGWVSNTVVGTGGSRHRGGRASGPVDHGHHAAFRIDAFRRAGGYDETFSHNEDAELDCRQRALGALIYLDAGNRVRYRPRSSWRGLWRQYFNYGRGRSRTVRRHPGSLRFRQLAVPLHVVLTAVALSVAHWAPLFLLWPAVYVGLLTGTSITLAARHRSVTGLLAGPAAAVMHTAWGSGFVHGLLTRREKPWRAEMAVPLWAEEAEHTWEIPA